MPNRRKCHRTTEYSQAIGFDGTDYYFTERIKEKNEFTDYRYGYEYDYGYRYE